MAPCDYEEADTRLLIHLHDAVLNNCTNCLVRTVNTDVVVILIGKFHHLITICQDVNIWVSLVRARTLHIITSILYLQRPWYGKIPGPSCLPQFQGMWYHVCIPWKRHFEEISMGGMELLSRCDTCLYLHGTPSWHRIEGWGSTFRTAWTLHRYPVY